MPSSCQTRPAALKSIRYCELRAKPIRIKDSGPCLREVGAEFLLVRMFSPKNRVRDKPRPRTRLIQHRARYDGFLPTRNGKSRSRYRRTISGHILLPVHQPLLRATMSALRTQHQYRFTFTAACDETVKAKQQANDKSCKNRIYGKDSGDALELNSNFMDRPAGTTRRHCLGSRVSVTRCGGRTGNFPTTHCCSVPIGWVCNRQPVYATGHVTAMVL